MNTLKLPNSCNTHAIKHMFVCLFISRAARGIITLVREDSFSPACPPQEESTALHLAISLAALRRAPFLFLLICAISQTGCQTGINDDAGKKRENHTRYHTRYLEEPKMNALEIRGATSSAVLSLLFVDNHHLCSGSANGVVKVFDVHRSDKEIHSINIDNSITGLFFLPVSNELISASTSTLHSLDYPNCSNVHVFFRNFQYSFKTFSSGKAIFKNHEKGILLLDLITKQIRTIPPPDGDLNGINTAAYSPKRDYLVAGGAAGILRRWDLGKASTPVRLNYHVGCPIFSVAVSPDGASIAVAGCDKLIRLLNASDGSVIKTLPIVSNGVDQLLLYAKKGSMLISIEPLDDNSHPSLIRFWDVKKGTEICPSFVGHKYRIRSASLSPDNSLLATGSLDGSILVWKIPGNKK